MTENTLKAILKRYDKSAVLRKEGTSDFRIFLFTRAKRCAILNAIAKKIEEKKDWKIERISDYAPILPEHPKTVIHLRRLRINIKAKRYGKKLL